MNEEFRGCWIVISEQKCLREEGGNKKCDSIHLFMQYNMTSRPLVQSFRFPASRVTELHCFRIVFLPKRGRFFPPPQHPLTHNTHSNVKPCYRFSPCEPFVCAIVSIWCSCESQGTASLPSSNCLSVGVFRYVYVRSRSSEAVLFFHQTF